MTMEKLLDTTSIKITSWPSPQEYNEAVQTPSMSFADQQLKHGAAEVNEFGLPKPRSGNFASVYKFASGDENWAVRCFLRSTTDQQQRYQAIEKALSAMNADFTVKFDYVEDGINICNRSYPILKMEWAEGQTLDEYVRYNLGQSANLSSLAERIKTLSLKLYEHGIAHGDLQHGNILVLNDGIKLVDYDGMYVPELEGNLSPELGHRNYQHPKRDQYNYSRSMDNFSAWVIYVSLICLSEDSTLWYLSAAGDDRLLFTDEDFKDPTRSSTFYTLENHKSEKVREHARFLRSLIDMNLVEIPGLDHQIFCPLNLPAFDFKKQDSPVIKKGEDPADKIIRSPMFPIYTIAFLLLCFLLLRASFISYEYSYRVPPVARESVSVQGQASQDTTSVDLAEANALAERADIAYREGASKFAVELYQQAIAKYEKLGAEDKKQTKHLAECWDDLAYCQYNRNEFPAALDSINRAIEYYQKLNDQKRLHNALLDKRYRYAKAVEKMQNGQMPTIRP